MLSLLKIQYLTKRRNHHSIHEIAPLTSCISKIISHLKWKGQISSSPQSPCPIPIFLYWRYSLEIFYCFPTEGEIYVCLCLNLPSLRYLKNADLLTHLVLSILLRLVERMISNCEFYILERIGNNWMGPLFSGSSLAEWTNRSRKGCVLVRRVVLNKLSFYLFFPLMEVFNWVMLYLSPNFGRLESSQIFSIMLVFRGPCILWQLNFLLLVNSKWFILAGNNCSLKWIKKGIWIWSGISDHGLYLSLPQSIERDL